MIICSMFFFFKQKTAYEMRISDWSSDVCSSDLEREVEQDEHPEQLPDLALGHFALLDQSAREAIAVEHREQHEHHLGHREQPVIGRRQDADHQEGDRKSTRLNSSH